MAEVKEVKDLHKRVPQSDLNDLVGATLSQFDKLERVLIIHPDDTRNDFTHQLVPHIAECLTAHHGTRQIDTLSAGGTHGEISQAELAKKLGLSTSSLPGNSKMHNHLIDRPSELKNIDPVSGGFMSNLTNGYLDEDVPLRMNKLIFEPYDLIVALSGTVPHEAVGFSGGTKIFLPGIAGNEIIGAFHWAAVMVGIPEILGTVDNPARKIIDHGVGQVFERISATPVLSFDMVYVEDDHHSAEPRGLFTSNGIDGFKSAFAEAASLSALLHVRKVPTPQRLVVQQLPAMYKDIWTASKGSYKLQKPGVLAQGAEIILYAPHIHDFHLLKSAEGPSMSELIRQIGYHGRDWVLNYLKEHKDFDLNIAAHVINARGIGKLIDGIEYFDFDVSLATSIPESVCKEVGLHYRDPNKLRREDFEAEDRLWIPEGGQWLYELEKPEQKTR